MGNETFYHALKINSEVCTGCTHCMNVCPTAAIRIKYGKATINEAACTDQAYDSRAETGDKRTLPGMLLKIMLCLFHQQTGRFIHFHDIMESQVVQL